LLPSIAPLLEKDANNKPERPGNLRNPVKQAAVTAAEPGICYASRQGTAIG